MLGVVDVFVLLLFLDVGTNLQMCPYGTHKKIRAKFKCLVENQYHCLLDRNHHTNIEMCTNPKYYRRGLRPVYKGNIDAEKCDEDNFSPRSIQSNENDKCQFKKSLCTEEGQLVFNNGSTEADRSCRCDFRRGYDFVIKPKTPCRCFPIDENCSCYKKKCREINHVLTPDYSCTQRYGDYDVFHCPRITNDGNQFQSTDPTRTPEIDVKNIWKLITIVLVLVCLAVLSVIITLLSVESSIQTVDDNKQNINATEIYKTDKESNMTRIAKQVGFESQINRGPILKVEPEEMEENGSDELPIDDDNTDNFGMHFTKENIMTSIGTLEFHGIQQLIKIKAAEKNKKIRLIILTGPNGAGKTQTALKFCSSVENQYQLISKVTATTKTIFIKSLKSLASTLSLKVTPESEANEDAFIDSIALMLINYFNITTRSVYSYLMIIDDVCIDIYPFISKLYVSVKNVRFIITTTEQGLLNKSPEKIRRNIEFIGMTKKEYLNFFLKRKHFKAEKNVDIDRLVKTIGTLPLTLCSARQYMESHNYTIQDYLELLKEVDESSYEENLKLNSNSRIYLLSLQNIIKSLIKEYEHILKVIECLPHLDYTAIRQDVIEACYHHFVPSSKNAKLATTRMVEMFSKHSLCHYVKDDQSKKGWLSFHQEAITALKIFIKQGNTKPTCELLWFLVKVFCFEIDPDVRIDISLERNLSFTNHARKLIEEIEQMDTGDESDEYIIKENQVFLSYLHYVIGKTLLFQAADIPFAHKYLMRARYLCLALTKSCNSDLTDHGCPYLKGRDAIPKMNSDDVVVGFTSCHSVDVGTNFVNTFVCGKFQNNRDKEILQRASKTCVGKSGYLSMKDFHNLSTKSFAMPLALISKGFLSELCLHICLYNGRALDELVYEAKEKDRKKVIEARDFEFQTCIKLAELMKSRKEFKDFPILIYLALDRGEQKYKLTRDCTGHSCENLETHILQIREIMEPKQRQQFQFGILKSIDNTREYHICECNRLLLKYYQQLHRISGSKNTNILSEGRKVEKKLYEILLEMEQEDKRYNWVEMPRFYIQCAKFLHLSETREKNDCELSIELYQKAIDFEKKRRVNFSRYLWEGYFGKAKCLVLLGRTNEAHKIKHELKRRFEGTNQDLRLQKLEKLFKE